MDLDAGRDVPEGPGTGLEKPSRNRWRARSEEKARRLKRVEKLARGRVLPTGKIVPALEELVAPRDRVALEGNNQNGGYKGELRGRGLIGAGTWQ